MTSRVAQWLTMCTGLTNVMGSNPVENFSFLFFVMGSNPVENFFFFFVGITQVALYLSEEFKTCAK